MAQRLPTQAIVGLAPALVAFIVHFTTTRMVTSDGRLTSCSYVDFFAIGASIGLFYCAATTGWSEGRDDPLLRRVALLLIAFGILHLLRGVGMVGGPCG
jgi:hypothetical protein